jgi:hypothetical protein
VKLVLSNLIKALYYTLNRLFTSCESQGHFFISMLQIRGSVFEQLASWVDKQKQKLSYPSLTWSGRALFLYRYDALREERSWLQSTSHVVVRGSVNGEKSPTARIQPATRTQKDNAAFSAGEQDMTKRTAKNHGQSMVAEVGDLCCLEAGHLPVGNKTILHGPPRLPICRVFEMAYPFRAMSLRGVEFSQLNRLERNATMK